MMIESLTNFLSPENLSAIHPALPAVIGIAGLLLLALVAHLIARFVLLKIINSITERTATIWDDALVHNRVFGRTAQVMPALIIFTGLPFVPDLAGPLFTLLRNVALAYMVLMAAMAVSATLRAAHEVYSQTPLGRERPIKGVVQIAQLGVFLLGAILVIAAVMDRSPLILLSGLGAMGAILLLVFKDTILGFVASVQLSSQDMVRVGDWIEMPQYAADGDVIDVALHTVKVQNWDKTITMIPTHALIANSFRNWRGMKQSGGRRIMRNVFLDMTSIRFLTKDEISYFKRFVLLADYMDAKQQELDEYNARLEHATDDDVNLRRLTNVGTFRAYLLNYLRNHPRIHQEMTLLVRQQPPGAEGLPMQVYAFCNDTKWENYEGVQADIFDHILAILPRFGLRVYQKPSGHDLQGLGAAGAAAVDDA